MEIFRELVPGLKRILVPYDATNAYAVAQLATYRDAARKSRPHTRGEASANRRRGALGHLRDQEG
jgi:hypothetical protein